MTLTGVTNNLHSGHWSPWSSVLCCLVSDIEVKAEQNGHADSCIPVFRFWKVKSLRRVMLLPLVPLLINQSAGFTSRFFFHCLTLSGCWSTPFWPMLRGKEDEGWRYNTLFALGTYCLGYGSLQASLNANLFVRVRWSLLWTGLAKRYFVPRGREQNASAKSAGTVVEASALDLPIPVTG